MFDIQTNPPVSRWATRRLVSRGVLGEGGRGVPSLHKLSAQPGPQRAAWWRRTSGSKKNWGMQREEGKICRSSAEQESGLGNAFTRCSQRNVSRPAHVAFFKGGGGGRGTQREAGINAAVSHKHRVGN